MQRAMRAIFPFIGTLAATACAWAQQPAPAHTQGAPIPAPRELTLPQEATPAPAYVLPNQQKAREIAETVYNTWRLAMMRADEQAWAGSTSAARQNKIRNMVVSERKQFPKDFFSKQPQPPQLEHFTYVGSIAGCGNRSMACTFVGKLQLGEKGKLAENAMVVELIFEGGKWKLDQTRFFNLSQLPDVKKRLHARDLSVLQEQDGFHPYDKLPAIPPRCGAPQLIGKVFVDAPGREIEMRINGVSLHEFYDERRADTIAGGLRRGQNTISYTIKDNAGMQHPTLGIGLFVMPETPGNHPVCVFDHILDAKDAAKGGTFTFTVSNEQIASMNPKFQRAKPEPYHVVPLKPKPQPKPEQPKGK